MLSSSSPLNVAKFPPRSRGQFKNSIDRLEGAIEEGLGLQKTKAGPGDKEAAYVFRQNNFLRFCLIISFGFVAIVFVLLSYMYQFNYIRWDAAKQEMFHFQSEHSAQTKLLDAQLELKEALETMLHQSHRVAEYRSYLERSLGDNGNSLKFQLNEQSHLNKDFTEMLINDNDILGTKMIKQLDAILEQFSENNKKATETLRKVSDQIIAGIEEDSSELEMHKTKLREYGIKDKNSLKKFTDKLRKDNKHWDKVLNDENLSQAKVSMKLEEFFKRVNDLSFPLLSEEVTGKWQKSLAEAISMINDSTREADLNALIRRTNEMILADTKGEVKLFDPKIDRSIIDYLKLRIYEANLVPHRGEIMKLFTEWKSGSKRTMDVWHQIESLLKEHIDSWLKS